MERKPACAAQGILLGCVLLLRCETASGTQEAKIHEGKYWIWFAREDQFERYKQDIERFYDYADKAFEYLCNAWGLRPPQEKYALFV